MTTRFTVVDGKAPSQLGTFVVAHIMAWRPNTEDTCVLALTSGDKVIVRGRYEDVDNALTRCLEAPRYEPELRAARRR